MRFAKSGINTMAHWERTEVDRRYNELNDSDGLWGPFACFRPAKDQPFTRLRALALIGAICGAYGMLLNIALAIGSRSQHLPKAYIVPTTLILIVFGAFELTLGPAWNRRAYLLNRRADYLARTRS